MKHLLRFLAALLILSPAIAAQQPHCPAPPPVLHWRNAITPNEVRDFLSHSKSILEWDANVATILWLNSGKLPAFWQKEILDSGFAEGLRLSWDSRLRDRENFLVPPTERR